MEQFVLYDWLPTSVNSLSKQTCHQQAFLLWGACTTSIATGSVLKTFTLGTAGFVGNHSVFAGQMDRKHSKCRSHPQCVWYLCHPLFRGSFHPQRICERSNTGPIAAIAPPAMVELLLPPQGKPDRFETIYSGAHSVHWDYSQRNFSGVGPESQAPFTMTEKPID